MDLTPASYRNFLQQLRILHAWGLASLIILLISFVVIISFRITNDNYTGEIKVLEKQKAISSHQRGILESLQSEYGLLSEKQGMLLKLRGGATANEMFINIDRALEAKDIWFTSWEFHRAGTRTNETQEEVNTGYFIIVPSGKNGEKNEAWKIQTHMEISGQALDHEALSRFVRKLLKQPQIHDVRVLNTQSNMNTDNAFVDFNIVVVVNTGVNEA